jgi:hypothetical protein
MSTAHNPTNPHPGANTADDTGGTSEETKLTVKRLGDEWIVENGVGKSIGSAGDRDGAIALARQAASREKASGIAILAADGSAESTESV